MRQLAMTMLLVAAPARALAQGAAAPPANAPCAVVDNRQLPPGFAAMGHDGPLLVAERAAGSAAVIPVGAARTVTLLPQSEVEFIYPAASKPAAAPHAGAVRVRVARAGVYRFALGDGAWIDVIGHGSPRTALVLVAHEPGPRCSAVRKIVDYRLETGEYAVQLSNAPGARIGMMVVVR